VVILDQHYSDNKKNIKQTVWQTDSHTNINKVTCKWRPGEESKLFKYQEIKTYNTLINKCT